MSDWWENPVLQGEDNEYGEYDYMVSYDYEHLPKSYTEWTFDKYKCKCDCCGKEKYLYFRSVQWFYTMDGGDSIDYNECWLCVVKRKVARIKRKIKKELSAIRQVIKWCIEDKRFDKRSIKLFYKIAKE